MNKENLNKTINKGVSDMKNEEINILVNYVKEKSTEEEFNKFINYLEFIKGSKLITETEWIRLYTLYNIDNK